MIITASCISANLLNHNVDFISILHVEVLRSLRLVYPLAVE